MIAQPEPRRKRWIKSPLPDTPEQQSFIQHLVQTLGISPILAGLLVQRGVCSFDEARLFFRPDISHLHDPFLMQDMDRAVQRLTMAILRQEKILVYGDYDVDGTTSVALFYGFLRTFYANTDFYIPDRYKEGYGISQAGVQWAADHDFSLIVALDCGIKSVDRVAEARALGIDFIICDHHRPGDELPDAAAVLDPKRDDCSYPYNELTGCGVGFKLLQAYCIFQNIPVGDLYNFLDLLAVSIAADIVPITGENRVLAYYGLKVLNKTSRPGLKALIKIAGLNRELDINSVVFGIGPRINAAGRIKHARAAVQLLLAETDEEAEQAAFEINENNNSRRQYDSSMTEQALAMIRGNEELVHAKSTVLYDATWHKGVIGIVASRCIEHFHRPTIILTQSHNKLAGSARSVPGFDVYEAIEECADLLEQFGGHTFAAGLTLSEENLPAFQKRFEEVVAQRIDEEMLTPMIKIDLTIDLDQIDGKFYRILKQMAPFGPQNLQPVFTTEAVYLAQQPIIMKEKHLKLILRQKGSDNTYTAVGFGMAHYAPELSSQQPFSICYQLDENTYNGNTTLQLMLKDIRVAEL
ncbi:single-stranded-DNA-specific exonuclease RecJ [Arsenicibacter rosenii]|uniref:Single-stranded-DNA-specific exonuclease RecJ n=1 Tax=Arsenicibacter rosenii TaxID=1750698 RepID=A0A1S2VIJ6_9BACT|nr:single-stranded-DNA-specific exonuclease RecJ [Arsenicibacter rosenii]OIN58581.1 single-stranded-DNA-specific exonuclease RecJ [Arsenicibacter rosenii]